MKVYLVFAKDETSGNKLLSVFDSLNKANQDAISFSLGKDSINQTINLDGTIIIECLHHTYYTTIEEVL